MARAEQRERTRGALLVAAAAEFEENGFAATTLGDVAARLGLVRATVHFHFATKEQLAEAIVQQELDAWENLRTASLTAETEPVARLRWLCWEMARRYMGDPVTRASIRLLAEHRIPRLASAPASGWARFIADQLRAARLAGSVPDSVQPDLVAVLLVGMFSGVLPTLADRTITPTQEQAQALVELFCQFALAGLSPR